MGGLLSECVGHLAGLFEKDQMKIGIIGAGKVGCACAMAAVIRGSAGEIVLVNRTRKTAKAVPRFRANDFAGGINRGV